MKPVSRTRPRLGVGTGALEAIDLSPVLLVDDDIDTHALLGVLLAHAGFDVTCAANGKEALALLCALDPVVILLDADMPVMNGLDFRRAQLQNTRLAHIPTVVMTGASEQLLFDDGVQGILRKPFRSGALLEAVRRCVP